MSAGAYIHRVPCYDLRVLQNLFSSITRSLEDLKMEEERGGETENVYTWETKYERTWYAHSYITVVYLVNKRGNPFTQVKPKLSLMKLQIILLLSIQLKEFYVVPNRQPKYTTITFFYRTRLFFMYVFQTWLRDVYMKFTMRQ